jgi:pre-mRNA-splicing factor 18
VSVPTPLPPQSSLPLQDVSEDILEHIFRIVKLCEEREYVQAGDQYLQMAIGNAPWPIGVTSVGIHDRAARTKISTSNVAHVMNDEYQRKYITSIKRLMTLCQKLYPTDPSKMLQ